MDEVKKEEEVQPEPQPLTLSITLNPDGKVSVSFPLLKDSIATYGLMKLGEKILDKHYAEANKSMIIPPKGGIRNFVRGLK